MIKTVFEKQRELMDKYEEIEANNGFITHKTLPVDINDKFEQLKLKEMAWRITEEMSEVMEEIKVNNIQNTHEELADVLHFLAEFTILLGMEDIAYMTSIGYKAQDNLHIEDYKASLSESIYSYGVITFHLAMACHELKNKPWKQSHRETDVYSFKLHLENVWGSYFQFCFANGLRHDALIHEYHKKHQVNVERQNSGY